MSKAAKQYEFTVEGRGEFPLDMLRYDRCWPKRESEDVGAIEKSFRQTQLGAADLYAVRLRGLREPEAARWKSFGWRVTDSRAVA